MDRSRSIDKRARACRDYNHAFCVAVSSYANTSQSTRSPTASASTERFNDQPRNVYNRNYVRLRATSLSHSICLRDTFLLTSRSFPVRPGNTSLNISARECLPPCTCENYTHTRARAYRGKIVFRTVARTRRARFSSARRSLSDSDARFVWYRRLGKSVEQRSSFPEWRALPIRKRKSKRRAPLTPV